MARDSDGEFGEPRQPWTRAGEHAGFEVIVKRARRVNADVGQRMKIPPVPLVPSPETSEAKAAVGFQWAGEPIGRRHRIGGDPEWLQSAETPSCSCGKDMSFYAQLDSLGDAHSLGDCGMIYVFVCWDCLETKSVLQSY